MESHIIIPIREIKDRMAQIESQIEVFKPDSVYSYALSKMHSLLTELLDTSKKIDL